jgi:glycosyltransferase involved in cell wall biosynthesis
LKEISAIQIIDSLAIGGAEMMAVNIANALSELGVKSFLCATRSEGELKTKLNDKVNFFFLKKKSSFDIKAILSLNFYIKKNKITIVHAHSSSFFIATLIKILNPKLKLIWHNHFGNSTAIAKMNFLSLYVCSYFFKTIISVNSEIMHWAREKLRSKDVLFLPNFPTLSLLGNTTLKGEGNKRIVCVAAFRREKNHLNLLKAFKSVLKNNPTWTLHLVGNISNDSYHEEIISYMNTNSMLNSVFIYYNRLDIGNILKQSTIGVLSSDFEGLPVSLLEYGISNIPAVTTDVGECNLIIKDKRFIVEPLNSNKLALALEVLINSDKERVKLATDINKIVQLNFSKQNTISQLINIYNKNC